MKMSRNVTGFLIRNVLPPLFLFILDMLHMTPEKTIKQAHTETLSLAPLQKQGKYMLMDLLSHNGNVGSLCVGIVTSMWSLKPPVSSNGP